MPTPTPPPADSPTAGANFQRLVDIMRTLRSPDGCPWDRKQTFESLRPFVLEEAYEVVETIDRRDYETLRSEIGDLLFEGVFLAQIADEEGRFRVDDSLDAIAEKLVRRHPHVFGTETTDESHRGTAGEAGRTVDTPEAVVEQWEQIKARERQATGEPDRLLGGLPTAMPSLLRAYEIGARVGAVGFDWARAVDVIDKVHEELTELGVAIAADERSLIEEELGDLLFTLASLARKLRVEPETALRKANDKFSRRFASLEDRLRATGRSIHEASLDEMERGWAAVKQDERR
jgi:MazG family protein